ncbi:MULTISPECIES: GH92 family glycosyl hydrolase [unclassified Lentimonas]|uniref:GH92 family glycosyl hydrolase n=1 Tax=unclassified Lentimonas TaxID=2630993 RepID=UPI00132C3BA7|nr:MULTISPECIES: GH92 family glycosyl hydrolase [unclassified Lentimonas]CAA6679333.1 Alpha-1,2-mannosidase [Lentimonas sp. CC4]CAA6686370.1 Alpha-1,2-mannosidase [Lentimonas sp. CC6]CAA7076144.1 Alpha-1,2-mannosidase [Lentimonas sp. CC4]CAA7170863.1 Alpha-1,2-mannosidase [Lentimonas sp. CC21]CAA7181195.1 Alpha-1,2-mannosidase [Lentimonas sp. CC8]
MNRGLTFCIFSTLFSLVAFAEKEPVDYVDPHIGGISELLASTDPIVTMPGGTVEIAPNPWPEVMNRVDHYMAGKVCSFSIDDVPIYGKKMTPTWIMATTGEFKTAPAAITSRYDHDFEIATPYYASVYLEDHDVTVENTATRNCAFFRFTFPEDEASHILFKSHEVRIVSDRAFEAKRGKNRYFYVEFSKPFASSQTWKGGAAANYATEAEEQVLVRVGVSGKSYEDARKVLKEELPNWDFDAQKQVARDVWNESLSVVQVEGGTERQRRLFYTGLYRVGGREKLLERMKFNTDKMLKKAQTFASRPSDKLLPHQLRDDCMFFQPNIVHAAKTIMFAEGEFDYERALENVTVEYTEATKLPWRHGPATELDRFHIEHGFYPALRKGEKETVKGVHHFENRQSVSLTLQAAYEAWCAAQVAKAAGDTEAYEYFKGHAYDYKNVFNTETNFVAPKDADGNWIEPYDPRFSGGFGGREYFAEMNGWLYTFYVPHDPEGLIQLMGGREAFIKKLDRLFEGQYVEAKKAKYDFFGQFPDMTGLVGMYTQGNEFSRHIPYFYIYAGEPWKTQRRVREIMRVTYDDDPAGICGDEDHGHMLHWYMMAAMGIHTNGVLPNYPIWLLSSPVFSKTTIDLGDGKALTIEAKDASAQNKYVQSAKLNGEVLNQAWFAHDAIRHGGHLILQMGPRPNKEWASAPEASPPSMTPVL